MVFQNFHYEEPTALPTLDVGDYVARIESAVDKAAQTGSTYVEITVSIQGKPGYVPNKMTYYDIPKVGDLKANGQMVTEEDVKKACGRLSRLLDAFKIPADQVSNLQYWNGRTGTVHCDWQYDPNESDKKSKQFKALYPKVEKKEGASASVTPAPANPQKQPAGNNNGFPEDISF